MENYFKQLLVESREEYLKDIKGNLEEIFDDYICLDINTVRETIKSLNYRREVGIGDVPAELLKKWYKWIIWIIKKLFWKMSK